MGYYTHYTLTVEPEEDWDKVVKVLHDVEPSAVELWWDDNELFGGEPVTWYSHEEDILSVSRQLPDTLLILDGEGEDPGDQWRMFARNGKKEVYRQLEWIPPEEPERI